MNTRLRAEHRAQFDSEAQMKRAESERMARQVLPFPLLFEVDSSSWLRRMHGSVRDLYTLLH